jgi:cysteinyl-tRNA synthetase
MDDDFNTPRALAALIAFSRDAEPYASKQIGRRSIELIVETFDYFGGVFGILQSAGAQQSSAIAGLVEMVLELRNEARKKGDWKSADQIRNRLASLGIALEDTATGTRWYVSSSKNESA